MLVKYGSHTLEGIDNVAIVDWDSTYKYANADEDILDFLNTYKPKDNHFYLRIINVAAGEYWGANNNADYFPEAELVAESPNYGYKTFMLYAKVYRNHANKDPNKALGNVIFATYNKNMHYVESILEISKTLAPDVWENVQRGIYPATSMGTRVPYDICSICGKRASKPTERCVHILFDKRKVYPDKGAVYMINVRPRFFDQSIVIKPADNIAWGLEQVRPKGTIERIHLTGAINANNGIRKVAMMQNDKINKLAAFDKQITPDNVEGRAESADVDPAKLKNLLDVLAKKMAQKEPPLGDEFYSMIATYPKHMVMSVLDTLGIVPTAEEMLKIDRITLQPNEGGFIGDEKQAMLKLARLLHDYMPERSWAGIYGTRRLEKVANDILDGVYDEDEDVNNLLTPAAIALPFTMAATRPKVSVNVSKKTGVIEKLLNYVGMGSKKPTLTIRTHIKTMTPTRAAVAGLAALGVGLLAQRAGNLAKNIINEEQVEGKTLTANPGEKTAALANSWMAVVPGMWFASNYYDTKKKMGYKVGPVGNFVAQHPVASTALTLSGLHYAGKMLKRASEEPDYDFIIELKKRAGLIYNMDEGLEIAERNAKALNRLYDRLK